MVVFSGGILLESDEVKTNSVAGGVPVVSHRNVDKALQYAKRIQYDATSKIAVDVVLSSCLKDMIVYPLQCKAGVCQVELWGETGNTKVLGMLYKTPGVLQVDTKLGSLLTLVVNRVVASKHMHLQSGSVATRTYGTKDAWNKLGNYVSNIYAAPAVSDKLLVHIHRVASDTYGREYINKIVLLSDRLNEIGWVITTMGDHIIELACGSQAKFMDTAGMAIDITRKVVRGLAFAEILDNGKVVAVIK